MDPIPWWVESYICLVGPYLDGGSPYWLPPPDDVVLCLLRGVGMASDRAEVTVVSSFLAGSVQGACSLSKQLRLVGLDLSPPLPEVRMEERS